MKQEIINKIIKEVCEYYNFTPQEVFNATHKRETVQTRQLCQFLISKYAKLSLSKVGLISLDYGRKRRHNHSTILNSIKEIENRLETDLDFYNDFRFIVKLLNDSIVLPVYPVFNIKNKFSDFDIIDNVNTEILKEKDKLKNQLSNISKYEAINELLSLEHSDILECIKYKIEPHLKML